MRQIPSNALTKLATQQGTEPFNYIEIEWVAGSVTRYGDKAGPGILPKILEISAIDEMLNLDGSGSSATISVTLDDTDGSIKNLMDQYCIHKKKCTIYQYFEGMSISDAFVVMQGQIVSPITWSESTRDISFSVLSQMQSNEVGFAIEEGQFQYIDESLIGQVWPVGFGDCVHVPAVKVGTTLSSFTLSLFGLPDLTLPMRAAVIQKNITALQDAYGIYVQYVSKLRASVPLPATIQEAYAQAIVEEDTYKQSREDSIYDLELLNKQHDTLIEDYNNTEDTNEKINIKTKIDLLADTREDLGNLIKKYSTRIIELQYDKKALQIDADNEVNVYQQTTTIRNKLIQLLKEYHKLVKDVRAITSVMEQQQQYYSSSVVIDNGLKYPQNVPIEMMFNGLRVLGTMNGNLFTVTNFLPTYANVTVGPKLDSAMDSFYINDPNYSLQGKYCLLSDGTIIKITDQSQTRCVFELKSVKKDRRDQKNDIVYNGPNAAAINQGLSHLLTGYETPDQLVQIANTMPKDLSKYIYTILAGSQNKQTIEVVGDVIGGTVKFMVDGFETDPVDITDSSADVKAALLTLPTLSQMYSNNPFTVTGGPLISNPIHITFQSLPMPTIHVSSDGLRAKWLLDITGTPTGGTVVYNFNNICNIMVPYNATAAQFNAVAAQYNNFFTASGDGLDKDKGIVVEFLDAGAFISVLQNNVTYTSGEQVIVHVGYATDHAPLAISRIESTGAHEHTKKKIDSIINSYIGKSGFKKSYDKAIKTLYENWDTLRELQLAGATADEKAVATEAYAKSYKDYEAMMDKIKIPNSVMEEAYKLLSKEEYRELFRMEVYKYLEWRRSMLPVQAADDTTDKYYLTGYVIDHIQEVAPTILPHWGQPTSLLGDQYIESLPTGEAFVVQVGESCSLANDYQEKYVANILESSIKAVYGRRSIRGIKTLVPIPSRYYVKNEADNFGAFYATTITLRRPLSEYTNEQWDDGISVTYTSNISGNTADVIDYIFTNYTNITLDPTNKSEIHAALANYPQNFVVTSKIDALELIKSVAYQARCQVLIKGLTGYIKYLSTEPEPVDTITEDDIIFGSMKLTYTDTENVNTRLIATWKPHYAYPKNNLITLRHNVAKYGLQTENIDFFTYNIYDLVMKSATFWMIRKSNNWKIAQFSTPINKLNLESGDCVTIDLENNIYCDGPVNGIIQSAVYDSGKNQIHFEVWLPVREGEMEQYTFAWPSDISATTFFPSISEMTSGYAGNPIVGSVPTGTEYDPYDPSLIAYRPRDYGLLKLADSADVNPTSPVTGFNEMDYSDVPATNYQAAKVEQISDNELLDRDGTGQPTSDLMEETKTGAELLSLKPTFAAFGRVVRDNGSGLVDSNEMPEGADSETQVYRHLYDVRLQNGQVVNVHQLQLNKDEIIPKGTVVLVTYDNHANEFQMQVPIFLEDGEASS